jgi:hypothetical protein
MGHGRSTTMTRHAAGDEGTARTTPHKQKQYRYTPAWDELTRCSRYRGALANATPLTLSHEETDTLYP